MFQVNLPLVSSPSMHTHYVDDLIIEAYSSSQRSFMGAQRKGISDPLPSANSYATHLAGALAAPFPLSVESPLLRIFAKLYPGLAPLPIL